MATILQGHEAFVRSRYRQAAIVYLVLGLIVMGLTHLPGMSKLVPTPFMSEWRVPIAVFAMFVATALIYGKHRIFTFIVSVFVLYRMVVLGLNALAARHVELRPDPTVVLPETWSDPTALQALAESEIATASPLYELSDLQAGNATLPEAIAGMVGDPAFPSTWVMWLSIVLLGIVVLVLWRAARHAV